MRNVIRIAVILVSIAVVFGCSSTKATKSSPEAAKSHTGEVASGSVTLEEYQVMAILAGDWGHGTLGYNGKVYKFKLHGMGAGGYGAQKISAAGEVYRLDDIADFSGGYSELRGGITVVKGVGGFYIRNDKGVVIRLRTHADGVALSIGAQGITIQLVEK